MTAISELGEQQLLQLLKSYCPASIVGDDAALLTPESGQQIVVTTDVLVEGVHFSDRTTSPHSVGWRAAAANLSDLAAMGAVGLGITVGLSLPPHCPVAWIEQLYQGMADCLALHSIPIVGGDVCRAEQRSIAITALGQVAPPQAWRRNTAQVGDAIVVTGSHGGSRAGLALLQDEHIEGLPELSSLERSHRDQLIYQHQYPQPRLDWVSDFRQSMRDQGREHRITAMDSSDGLADALCQICAASGVGAKVSAIAIPTPTVLQCRSEQALNWVMYGGEDFELVLCLAPELATEVCTSSDLTAVKIGEITTGSRVALSLPDSSQLSLNLNSGFQHFA